ncbi:MAG: NHLP family bacteriocin export ABC transporter peptidase/permease/ATPase subunit [Candidatus Riflebacteria bacterium]|nr:NHLP family bacteriocin export ABC transporter peptidase/permease/ATPase subunit [Candidatus Riflebacteria bacterium]
MVDRPRAQAPTARVRTPTVLQMEAVECGAAALAIVLGYHGRTASLEELRIACGVSRDGTNAGNILKAARGYGLVCKGYSKETRDIAFLPMPAVVFWNFNHFVVVEGFSRGRVYLNDPAMGPRVVTEAEFGDCFTGVVLVFQPGPEFEPGGDKVGLLDPLRRRLVGSEAGLLYVFMASLALAFPGLVTPAFTQAFVDYCLVSGMTDWIGGLLLGMALAAVLRAALTWLQQHHLLRLETKLALTSSYKFFRHVLHLPVEFFTQRYAGEVGSRVEMNDRIAQLLSRDLSSNLLNVLMAVFYVVMMLHLDVMLTLVGVTIAALNGLALQVVSRSRKDENMRLLQERAKMMGTSMSGLQTIETLKATGAESDFFSRWSGHLAKVMVAEQRMGLYGLCLGTVPPFLGAVNTIAILGLGSLRVIDGHLTVGMLVAFQSLMMSFTEPIDQLVGLGGSLQEIEGELHRLDDVLRYPVDPNLENGQPTGAPAESPVRLAGQLELKEITYGYSRLERPLLERFTLTVRPGSRVALVGPSASGKSTLAKLVTGLYEPWSGEVLLDRQPRSRIDRAVVTNSLAMVDQDFFLFEGTVREILTMWDSTIPDEDVIQAAKDACIHDDIAARPGGYESRVEEGGVNFSGGQRQRLEIARALVGNPTLLVLDEATSALDPVTEKTIDDNLRRRGCTLILVAHRLSTIRDCDEIVVLDRGQIVQRGTHEALHAVDGLYRRLIHA